MLYEFGLCIFAAWVNLFINVAYWSALYCVLFCVDCKDGAHETKKVILLKYYVTKTVVYVLLRNL